MRPEPDVVFVGGVGRSGTSITREILRTHPDIAGLPFEYRFIIDPDGIIDFLYGHEGNWNPYVWEKKFERLKRLLVSLSRVRTRDRIEYWAIQVLHAFGIKITKPAYFRWELSKHIEAFIDAIEELISHLPLFEYDGHWVGSTGRRSNSSITYFEPGIERRRVVCKNFVYRILSSLIEGQKARLLVEDNTWNLLHAQSLNDLFPSALFIHVVRDPRDVVASFVRQNWMSSDVKQSAQMCSDLYQQIFTQLQGIPEKQKHIVSLERLIADSRLVIKDICEFVGIDDSRVKLAPMNESVVGKWESQFTGSEKVWLNDFLQSTIKELDIKESNW